MYDLKGRKGPKPGYNDARKAEYIQGKVDVQNLLASVKTLEESIQSLKAAVETLEVAVAAQQATITAIIGGS